MLTRLPSLEIPTNIQVYLSLLCSFLTQKDNNFIARILVLSGHKLCWVRTLLSHRPCLTGGLVYAVVMCRVKTLTACFVSGFSLPLCTVRYQYSVDLLSAHYVQFVHEPTDKELVDITNKQNQTF